MKTLSFILVMLLTFGLHAQSGEVFKMDQPTGVKKQATFCLKIQPASLILKHIKIGLDYAVDAKTTIELQAGKTLASLSSKHRDNFNHIQFRYKRDLYEDKTNLSGLYYAPGIELASIDYGGRDRQAYYSTIFGDIGYQLAYGAMNFEIFGGMGVVVGEHTGSFIDCIACGRGVHANSLNIGLPTVRMGLRVGIQR